MAPCSLGLVAREQCDGNPLVTAKVPDVTTRDFGATDVLQTHRAQSAMSQADPTRTIRPANHVLTRRPGILDLERAWLDAAQTSDWSVRV